MKQYKFLSNGETQVDGVDDAHMFGVTEVSHFVIKIVLHKRMSIYNIQIVYIQPSKLQTNASYTFVKDIHC